MKKFLSMILAMILLASFQVSAEDSTYVPESTIDSEGDTELGSLDSAPQPVEDTSLNSESDDLDE